MVTAISSTQGTCLPIQHLHSQKLITVPE